MARPSRDAALSVVPGNLGQRPDPPADLIPAEAAVWRSTVASEAVEFFRTDALREMLKDYCRHKVTAADLSAQVALYDINCAMTPDVIATLDKLLKMRERETKAAGDKARQLRLTNQSRYTPQAAATAAKNATILRKPWEPQKQEA